MAQKKITREMPKKVVSGRNQKQKRGEKGYLWGFLGASLALILTTFGVVSNFATIRDFFIGISYRPTTEMEQIRADLGLTDRGTLIFNASLPELMERTEFNQKCREVENETAVLGCYTDEKIYIYNIVDEELPGIRELATAHELLHAVFDRMSDGEKEALVSSLTHVFEDNQDRLESEINIYPVEQRQEELYVRAGTEIKNLPEELEKHFAGIFADQDKIVDYYDGYIKVFREIEGKLKQLLDEINTMKTQIDAETTNYEAGVSDLNTKIGEFNDCAETLNCFTSTAVFNSRRGELIAERERLKKIYDKINTSIAKYNNLVNEYNENVLHGQTLNMTINSNANVEEVAD